MTNHSVVAEFETVDQLINVAKELRSQHYTRFDVYSPYPIHELEDVVPHKNPLPTIVLIGGLTGAAIAWSMQTYIAVYDYPLNVGGRPLYSWPSFIVILFELTVLCAALSAFFGSLFLSGFPQIYHPLFGVPSFKRVMRDGFFVAIDSRDPVYRPGHAEGILQQFTPMEVTEIAGS